ncbi:hypothetical protein [Actinoplanes sp. ATCC 53533]|uniref:hypothetical protein n=1 Tax=Actinoplanes sp. ATCC 53533 TaxID=1288362 RepID=UPI0018F59ACC|nr:hypothetical protein [Actinoplanes sp. ATCC 53533]
MILLLKLALAPALVVGSSMAGRRWGPPVAGTLVALPIVAGPILLIISLDQGTTFGAHAASAALLGLVSLSLFALILAWACQSMGWWSALLVAWAGTLVADICLSRLAVRPGIGLLLVLASAWTVAKLLPKEPSEPGGDLRAAKWPWWDLPGRAAGVLVVIVTTAASALGPQATGVLAPFPIATSVLTAFVLAQRGPAAAVRVLRGIPHGLLGFAVFCVLVAVLIKPLGARVGFTLATVGTLTVQLIWRRLAGRDNWPRVTGPGRRRRRSVLAAASRRSGPAVEAGSEG